METFCTQLHHQNQPVGASTIITIITIVIIIIIVIIVIFTIVIVTCCSRHTPNFSYLQSSLLLLACNHSHNHYHLHHHHHHHHLINVDDYTSSQSKP